MGTSMIKLKIINLDEQPVQIYRRATEPITEKNEEQTKKLGENFDEETEKLLALMIDLIKFDVPPKVPMLLDAPIPEEAARSKETVILDVDFRIDKNAIARLMKILTLILNSKCLLNC